MPTQQCSTCAAEASESATFCPQCGSPLAQRHLSVQPPQARVPSQAPIAMGSAAIPAFKFNAERWSTADRITGVATIALFIALFLPWFGFNELGINEDGLQAHGFLYLVLFVAIAIVVYLGARAGWDKLPIGVSFAHSPAMFVATIFNLALTVIGFIWKPGSGLGWDFGSFMALIAAGVAAAPTAIPAIQARRTRL
jgi:hypothetical protein